MLSATDELDMAETCITSGIDLIADPFPGAFVLEDVPGVGVVPGLAVGEVRKMLADFERGCDNMNHPTCALRGRRRFHSTGRGITSR